MILGEDPPSGGPGVEMTMTNDVAENSGAHAAKSAVPARREWMKPELRRMSAGDAENGLDPQNPDAQISSGS